MPIDDMVELFRRMLETCCRRDTLDAIALFLRADDEGRGGRLVLQARAVITKSTLVEAGFRTERYAQLV